MSVSAATSVASAAATIFDSKDDKNEVTEIIDYTSNDIKDDNTSNDNTSNVNVFLMDAWYIMNRASRKIGMVAVEDCRFHNFFCAWKEIVKMVWDMLGEGSLYPENSKPKHLLWALYFLKVYLREGPRCCAVGGLKGAINPKTMHKWVWLFLERITKLADIMAFVYAYLRPL
jgi:hypothetical protein